MRDQSAIEMAVNLYAKLQRIDAMKEQKKMRELREKYYPQQMEDRLQSQNLRNQMLQERLKEYPELNQFRMNHMRTMERLKGQSLRLRAQQLMDAKSKFQQMHDNFNLKQQQYNLSMQNAGLPFEKEGHKFTKAGTTLRNLDDLTISALPDQQAVMQEIINGAQHFVGSPEKLRTYVAGLQANLTGGKVTKEQQKIINESGVSLNAMSRAVDSAQRVLAFPKTNEGMKTAFGLYAPSKNDNAESWTNRLMTQYNDMRKKGASAMVRRDYGVPSNPESENFLENKSNEYLDSGIWAIDNAGAAGAAGETGEIGKTGKIGKKGTKGTLKLSDLRIQYPKLNDSEIISTISSLGYDYE